MSWCTPWCRRCGRSAWGSSYTSDRTPSGSFSGGSGSKIYHIWIKCLFIASSMFTFTTAQHLVKIILQEFLIRSRPNCLVITGEVWNSHTNMHYFRWTVSIVNIMQRCRYQGHQAPRSWFSILFGDIPNDTNTMFYIPWCTPWCSLWCIFYQICTKHWCSNEISLEV